MHRLLLSVLWFSGASAAPVRPAVPFDAAVYAEFAMPYPDNGRTYDTSTLSAARQLLGLPLPSAVPAGFKRLGSWTTSRSLADATGPSPAALLIATRDVPGPPSPSAETAALIVQVTRFTDAGNAARAAVRQQHVADGTRTVVGARSLYTTCRPASSDYPALTGQLKTLCISTYVTPKVSVRVSTINLSAARTVTEARRVVAALGPVAR